MDNKIIGVNLRRIRQDKGLSQEQVAEFAGISRITYRNIENGASMPKVSTLQNISTALSVKLQDLIIPVPTLTKVRFRASKKMNSRDTILTDVAYWLQNFNYLEDLLNDHEGYKFKNFESKLSLISRQERPRKAAEIGRKMLKLDENTPIRDIAGLLESAGIKVYPITLVSDNFFGLSVAEGDGGPAIIVNVWDRISVERWIFSAAHELGHLLLHLDAYNVEEDSEVADQEAEADVFASYFLMPEQAFINEWKDTRGLPLINGVFKVKRIFQVSYKTVLYRLQEITGDDSVWSKFYFAHKTKTGKSLSRKDEPEALPPDSFQQAPEALRSREPESLSSYHFMEDRLSKLVRTALENEQITMGRAAEILKLNLEDMREVISSWV